MRGAKLLRSGWISARSKTLPSFAKTMVPVAGSKFANWLSFSSGGVAYS